MGDVEPLLRQNSRRYSLYPIKHRDIWEAYKEAEASFWQVEEVKLDQDIVDWRTIPENIKKWVSMTLAFFQVADGLVCENLTNNFSSEVQIPEARCFFGFQIAIENIHAECYSMLVDTLISPEEKDRYYDAIDSFPSIKLKMDWCQKWTDSSKATFAERLVAWACTEMIMFSSSFATIFYVKAHLKKMNGLSFSNELISRDEGMHCRFGCLLYSKLNNKLTTDRVHEIVQSAVDAEKQFVLDALGEDIPKMTPMDMCNYVEFVADLLCGMLGVQKIYNRPLPDNLMYMESINLRGQSNFFERRVSSYSVKPLQKEKEFSMCDDF